MLTAGSVAACAGKAQPNNAAKRQRRRRRPHSGNAKTEEYRLRMSCVNMQAKTSDQGDLPCHDLARHAQVFAVADAQPFKRLRLQLGSKRLDQLAAIGGFQC